MPSVNTRRVDAGGTGLDLIEAGEGGRPLLVLHGFCGAKESFSERLPALAARGWHVVVPDQRGHGSSDHPTGEGAYSFERFVDDAVALVDALGWDRLALLGHSMGGMTSQRLAVANQHRLDGLVLMDTSHRKLELDPELAAAGRDIVRRDGLEGLVEALRDTDGPLVTPAHRRLLTDRPGYQAELDAQTLACSAEMWLSMSEEMFAARDVLAELRSLELPTLVIVGEQDRPFLGPSRAIAEAIPGARIEVIAEAGHSPQLEAPAAWTEVLTSFLDVVASSQK
ncbi:MAG: alpha/beta fold hydrolase [Acidimicrobiales bacterium]